MTVCGSQLLMDPVNKCILIALHAAAQEIDTKSKNSRATLLGGSVLAGVAVFGACGLVIGVLTGLFLSMATQLDDVPMVTKWSRLLPERQNELAEEVRIAVLTTRIHLHASCTSVLVKHLRETEKPSDKVVATV